MTEQTYPPATAALVARLDLIEQDLDCDYEGSLAESIADLRTELCDLRAMVEELRA